MKIYFTGTDGGDGSIGVQFFDDPLCIEILEEHDFETYRGEGGGEMEVIGIVTGIPIQTMKDVREHLEEYLGIDWDFVRGKYELR